MDVCDRIRRERAVGTTRCTVVDRAMSIGEAARVFGLDDDPAIYRDIDKVEADAIAHRILSTDLAYGTSVMSGACAAELWEGFLALFGDHAIKFSTNAGEFPAGEDPTANTALSFNPATEATFDLGVIAMSVSKSGCLWVEDED